MHPPTPYVQTWIASQSQLRLTPLIDPVIDAVGYDTTDFYAETYWLPVIGPSSLWALRRLATWMTATPDGLVVPLTDLAHELGLGGGTGRNAPVVRTLARLVVFEMAQIDRARESLAVRRRVPPLARRHIRRLPEHLALLHGSGPDLGQATLEDAPPVQR